MNLHLCTPSTPTLSLRPILLLLVALLVSGCATQAQYPTMTKIVNAQEVESDPASKMANLSHDQLISKGDAYLQNNNHRLARLHYAKALDKKPESMAAAIGFAKVLFGQGKFKEAAAVLEDSLGKTPSHVPALVLLGVISRNRGDMEGSLTWLNKAYEQRPQDPEILTELAITNDHIGQERLTYAEPLYKKVISLRPDSPAAHNNLGFNYLLQGRHQEAIGVFSKALALAPDDERAKNNLAVAYLLDNQPDQALSLFQNTVGQAAAYNNLGYIHMTRGNWQQAKLAFKKALQFDPSFYVRAQQNLDRLELLQNGTR